MRCTPQHICTALPKISVLHSSTYLRFILQLICAALRNLYALLSSTYLHCTLQIICGNALTPCRDPVLISVAVVKKFCSHHWSNYLWQCSHTLQKSRTRLRIRHDEVLEKSRAICKFSLFTFCQCCCVILIWSLATSYRHHMQASAQ